MAATTATAPVNGSLQVPRPKGRFTRRLSSKSVTEKDLAAGPTTIAPPDALDKDSDAHEVASAMEHARRGMQGLTTEDDDKEFSIELLPSTITDKYAFAFDIDGVLIRGGEPIPEAISAMKMLNGQNSRGIRV